MVLPELGEKKPAQRGGQKVGNTDSSTVRGAPNSPSFRFTRRALVFRYYLLNIAGEAETATPLPNSLCSIALWCRVPPGEHVPVDMARAAFTDHCK